MKYLRYIVFLLFSFLLFLEVSAQKNIILSGYIRDSVSAENLYNATIYERTSSHGTTSNAYGFYSLTVPAGKVNLRASFVGYKQQQLALTVLNDTIINFMLPTKNDLQEIIVTAKNTEKQQILAGHEHIDMQTVKALPGFAGEQDVLKSLTILPGVQQGHEGSSGLFVRGGSPDQNLILLDGVPVYNAAHLFGFVSVFTPEAIQSVDFYKSGFPARYGGRLSSVVDVRMKEGNKNKAETNLDFGLISSKITHEGPIKKGKSSYLISARRTLLDMIVTNVARINKHYSDNGAIIPGLNFYDVNLKLNFDLNARNRLYGSFYTGGDHFFSLYSETDSYQKGTTSSGGNLYQLSTTKLDTKVSLKWGNKIGALRWNSQIGNRLFLNTTLSSGMFCYTIHNHYKQVQEEANEKKEQWSDIKYETRVNNNKLQLLFDWYLNSHKIQFGTSGEINLFIPGQQEIKRLNSIIIQRGNSEVNNKGFAFFVDDQLALNKKITIYGGARLDLYKLNENWFSYVLPRINIKFTPSSIFNLSLSYDEMAQPIHLLTNSSIGLPSDIWVPATKNVPPEFSRQISLGTQIKLNNYLHYKLDSYYKKMNGVINYKAGQSFMDIYNNWENLVEIGTGKAWGVENALNYEGHSIKGWLNYTLSWNNRRFEKINNNEAFPFKFDRRHDINLGIIYKLSPLVELSAIWTFQSGQAATVPQQDYLAAGAVDDLIIDFITGKEIEDLERIQYIKGYNKYRLPAFHHLDIGLTLKKQRKTWKREWKLGVYNIYARQNAYMYYPYTTRNGYRKYKQISLFPFVPSISYHIQF